MEAKKNKLTKRERKEYIHIAEDLMYSSAVISALCFVESDDEAQKVLTSARCQ